MPSESTPLIQTIRVAPPRQRYTHSTVRRFFTIASTCLLVAGLAFFAVNILLIEPLHYDHGRVGKARNQLKWEELKEILMETPSAKHAKEWSRYYTAGQHLAGANYSQVSYPSEIDTAQLLDIQADRAQAEWTMNKWEEWGIASRIEAYDTYLNYPEDHSLTLLERKKGKKSENDDDVANWKVSFNASLTEDVLKDDPTTSLEDSVPTFHGYSASGNVTGSLVYVNYGTYQDFQDLIDAGIDLKGKVAIARYGGIFRGLKVKRPQELGMVGTIIYSDPGDDGEMTEENGYKPYPEGPARNPSSVQRGSVQFLSIRPGDP
jgi:N-acetylated-alpha-linked acidic dipeptidase